MTNDLPKLAWSDFEKRLFTASADERLPLTGALELTYRCNFRCVHCYQQDSRAQAEVPAAEWCGLIDQVAQAGTLWVTLTGGEPFLHPGFDEIYEHAIRAGILVTLFSNGSSLTEQRVARLKRLPPRTIETTLYGFSAETYQRVTGDRRNFERAVEGVRRATEAGLTVQVKTMVFDDTVGDFEAIETFARDLGLSFRFDALVHPTLGRSLAPARHRLSPGAIVALESSHARRRVASNSGDERATGNRVYRCGAGRSGYTIAPDGALQLCSLVRTGRIDLRRVPFGDAWQALGFVLDRKYSQASKCAGCHLRAECGTCPGIAAVERGDEEAEVPHLCETARMRSRGQRGQGVGG